MAVQGVDAGRLLLRSADRGLLYPDCQVFLRAPPGKRIIFHFLFFDIHSPAECSSDNLQLFDDRYLQQELTGAMCNLGLVPAGVYTSTGQDAAVRLHKNNYLADQVELIFTAFHLAPCRDSEFQCHNSHCIDKTMRCDDYDSCGDASDMCLLGPAGVAGVVIASVILIVFLAALIAALLYRRHRRRRQEKKHVRRHAIKHGAAWSESNGRSEMFEVPHSDSRMTGFSTDASSGASGFVKSTAVEEADTMKTQKKRKWKKNSKGKRSAWQDESRADLDLHTKGVSKETTLKKVRYEDEVVPDIYSIPIKPSSKTQAWGETCCNGSLHVQNQTASHARKDNSNWSKQAWETNTHSMEGMAKNGDSQFPVYELDVMKLEDTCRRFHPPTFYDHIFSFRRYPSGAMRKAGNSTVTSKRMGYRRLQRDCGHSEYQTIDNHCHDNSSSTFLRVEK
ncbi:hypothetical protein C0Q70_19269 [Pomacea canaliculata]|uniref:CUB domain-containing protein n=2 Tax=Pomacea canaliculata TaxID=400727 RepID=A0A2T7NIV1_POMCA|nr:hypothetical protein C0Q70_19269 [Pomacea canaliculata]